MIYLSDDNNHESLTIFKQFAKDNQGKNLVYTTSAINSGFGKRLAEYIGVKEGPTVRLISFKGKNLVKYIIDDLSVEGLL